MKKSVWVLTVLASLLLACSAENEKANEVAIKVDGDRAKLAEPEKAGFLRSENVQKDGGSVMRLPGRLVWNEDKTVRIFPQLGGRVQQIKVNVGETVKAGQPLATLASPDYGQALSEAKKAEADWKLAKQAQERNRELLEGGVLAKKDWQQSEAEAIRAGAESERTSKRMAQLGGGDGTYVLKSPLAGVVVERALNPGQEFRPDQAAAPLFVVTDPTSLWIQIDANEADLAGIKPGVKFVIEVKQYPGEQFAGVIRHVADFVDPASRTVKVRGEVANADRRLKGEMFVGALVDMPASDLLRVPAKAVFLQGEKRYVFVEEGAGSYRRQAIEAGAEREGWVEVLNGLKAGEKVVVEGNLHLLKFFKTAAAK